MKPKLRVSYSLLTMWKRGLVDKAVATYLHEEMETNQAIDDGRRLHKEVEDLVLKDKKLPTWAGNFKLLNPEPEKHLRVSYNELFDLSCKLDVLDAPIIYEFKTGKTPVTDWATEVQVPLYFLACNLAKISISHAYLIHYNQHKKQSEYMVIHNSMEAIDRARNEVDSLAPEIYNFFEHEGYL